MKSKKKIFFTVILTVAAISLCACGRLVVTEGVQTSIQSSSIYEKEEIKSAIDMTIAYFETNFKGCTMTKITYDEDYSMKQSAEWASQYEEDEAIILTSVFYIGSDPNAYYYEWIWVLTRSEGGDWTLQTWGAF